MLRVCGITYDHTINYGSCFQAYALQMAIEKIEIGGEPCEYKLIPIKQFKEWPKYRNKIIQFMVQLFRRKFIPFENRYMKFIPINSLEQLPRLNEVNDVFVCGSDVIWNPDFNCGMDAFYLGFAKKYKFSYAASFGKAEISKDFLCSVQPFLRELNAISVREASGCHLTESCTNKPTMIVADPVLLLRRNEWDKIGEDIQFGQKYIFAYITHLNSDLTSFLNKLKQITGLRVVHAAYGPHQALKQRVLQIQSPERWLQLLRDAEYVVTNSFHATAFSVLFHKKFFTVVKGEKDKGINVRMNDFLNTIGLGDRILSAVPEHLDLSEIDFTSADQKIDALREESLTFLRENLEAAYKEKLELGVKEN